jgi:putative ABC transport system permease protein
MSLARDLSHSWRSLRRAPLFTAAVVLTLTIGIGSATAIFAVVDAVLIRPLPYGHPDRLAGVWLDMAPLSMFHTQQSPGTYLTYRKFSRSIDGIGIYQTGSTTLLDPGGEGNPQRVTAVFASASTLPLLELPPMMGRTFNDEEDAPNAPLVAVISEGLWRSRYGADPNIVGTTILMSAKPARVIGVMPARFRFPNADVSLWMPLHLDPNVASGGFGYNVIARLKPGVTAAAAQRDFTNVLPRVVEIVGQIAPHMSMQKILDQAKPVPRVVSMRDDLVGGVSRTLWIVAATAILVLLVTCANVANLLLVRADGRHRELSVRAALGAGQRRVLLHFFTESALLTAISAAFGLALAWVGVRLLVSAAPAQIPRLQEIHINGVVVLFTVAVAAIVATACSAIPAVRFARADVLSGLRDGGRSGTIGAHRQRARSALVTAQMAFALVVLATSGLLFRSFQRLRAVQPGFDATGVATLWVALPSQRFQRDSSIVQFYARLDQALARLPGVTSAGLTATLPLNESGGDHNPFYVEGDASSNDKIPQLAQYTAVDSGYFGAMKIPMLAGHGFRAIDSQRGDEAVISIDAARLYFHDSTGRAAIGKRFQELPNSQWYSVIGVVGGVRDTSLTDPPARTVYVPESNGADSTNNHVSRVMALVARTNGDVGQITRGMQRVVHDLDPTLPTFAARSMQETVDASMARLTFMMIVLGVAAAVTLILSIVGLYGVIAYVVTLRTRELGVRIALGAQPSSVAAMVTRQGLVLCIAGVIAGLVIVAATTRFVRSFLFEVAPSDPVAIGLSAALLVAFALLASWIPARRAANVNPIEALRAD